MKNEIIIEVRGGNIQAVYASPDLAEAINVTVLDYDNIGVNAKMNGLESNASKAIETGRVRSIEIN